MVNTACDDWTDMEPKFQEDMTQSSLPKNTMPSFVYKKTDHPVAFRLIWQLDRKWSYLRKMFSPTLIV